MTLWLIFAVLTLAVLALLLWPLLRRPAVAVPRFDFDLQVYRQQLAELDRDQERGLLAADQVDAARLEIHRRMLAAEAEAPVVGRAFPRHLILAGCLAIALPIFALGLYGLLGAPGLPGRPFASRQSDPAFKMAGLIEQLAAKLAAAPDGEGYRRLAAAYLSQQRFDDAVAAYARAESLGARDSATLAGHGEALVLASGGMVVPDARRLFLSALQQDSDNPQARFYLGLAETQIGDFRKAVAIWRDLEAGSAADAPWLAGLRQQIADAGQQGGFDPATVPAQPIAQPTAQPATKANERDQTAAAIKAQSPEEQAKTIHSMVDGLAARLEKQPDDFDGWMRLALSYKVLGEKDKGLAAARHAIALKPAAVEPRLALAQLQLGEADDKALPADFLATLREVLAIDPANSTALYYLGTAAAVRGDKAEARRFWEKLLSVIPQDQPERAEIASRLASLAR